MARALLLAAPLWVWLAAVAQAIDFAHDIAPILREHCVDCHGGKEAKGGFSLNTRELLLDAGVALPGEPEASYLLELVRSDDPDTQMPPPDRERVPPADQARLTDWVAGGLTWESGFTFGAPGETLPLQLREVELPGPAGSHPIDQLVAAYAKRTGASVPEPVDDRTFLRRVSLDLVGLLPSPDEQAAYAADSSPDKAARLVGRLLSRDIDYAEHWLSFWNDLLRNDYEGTGFITGGRTQISQWLYESLVENKPFDQFVRELIAPPTDASRGFIGGIKWRGNVSAGQRVEIQFSQNVSQSFLGINMKCASCHDSFIDSWQLEDAYGLAAVYATEPLEIHRCDRPTGQVATSRWLYPELGEIDPEADRQERLGQLAGLLTAPANGRFSRTIVNRLWARLFGRGLVEPVDAMHTLPWDEPLLDYLANYLVEHDYDLKQLLRLIATSEAYRGRAVAEVAPGKASGDETFRGPLAKRMTAEQFLDAVWQLTGAAPDTFDAPILRGQLDPEMAERIEPAGEWIWGPSADAGTSPAGETVVFRRTVALDAPVQRGVAVITADNGFELYLGRRRVATGDDWTRVRVVPLSNRLAEGDNDLVIVAHNGGTQPNPAGLYFEARLVLADGSERVIASDSGWEVSVGPPLGGKEGRLGRLQGPWQAATPLGRPEIYDRVSEQFRRGLAMSLVDAGKMVRASLLKNDPLMRSLGRPGREQVVTSRPDELTTLEAIDLANGQRFADALSHGAKRLIAESGGETTTLIDHVYLRTLCRLPAEEESELLRSTLGPDPEPSAVADFLWAVLMTPEFFYIQ